MFMMLKGEEGKVIALVVQLGVIITTAHNYQCETCASTLRLAIKLPWERLMCVAKESDLESVQSTSSELVPCGSY